MKYCWKCGRQLYDEDYYCGACGTKQDTGESICENSTVRARKKDAKVVAGVLISAAAILSVFFLVTEFVWKPDEDNEEIAFRGKNFPTDAVNILGSVNNSIEGIYTNESGQTIVFSRDGTGRLIFGNQINVFNYTVDGQNIVYYEKNTVSFTSSYEKSGDTIIIPIMANSSSGLWGVLTRKGSAPASCTVSKEIVKSLDGVYDLGGFIPMYVFEPDGTYRVDTNQVHYSYENVFGKNAKGEKVLVRIDVTMYSQIMEGNYFIEGNILTLLTPSGESTEYYIEKTEDSIHLFEDEYEGVVFRNLHDVYLEKEIRYREGRTLYNQGKCNEAYDIFKALGEYMDSDYWCLKIEGKV